MQVRPLVIAAALLPVGACLAMDPAGWSPFGPAKWLAVSVLTLAAIALSCGGGRLRVARGSTVAWGVLIVLMAVAAIGGLDPLYAWTGTPERHLGVLGWLLIGAAFVVGQQLRWSDRTVIAGGVVAAGWVVGVYTAVEAAWRAPIRLDTSSDRLGGPFGSPAFLGAACALLVPAVVGIALDRSLPSRLRAAAVPAAVGCTFALIGSAARAAWLAVGLIAVAAMISVRVGRRTADGSPVGRVGWRSRRMLGVGFGIAAVGVLCAVLLGGQIGSALERTHGAGSRVDEWRVAVQVIGERPVFGTGPEGYRVAVPGNVDAAYERAYGRDVMPDRAHGAILDVTATGGVSAGLAYMALLGMLAVGLWRAVRRGGPLLVGLAAGVSTYLLQQQLLFPLAELDPVAWLLAGAVIAWTPAVGEQRAAPAPGGRSGDTAAREVDAHPVVMDGDGRTGASDRQVGAAEVDSPSDFGRRPAPRWQVGLGAVASVLAVISLVAGVLDVAADRLDKRSLDAVASGRVDDAVDLAQRAVDLRPDVVRYRLVLGRAEEATGTLSGVDRWLDAVDDALDLSPLDPIARQERGLGLNRRAAITGTDEDTSVAIAYWQGLVADDTNNARWRLELGRAAAAAGDVPTARTAWTVAAELAPDDPTATSLLAALPPE